MVLACIAIIGSLCFSDTAVDTSAAGITFDYQHGGLFGAVEISDDKWKVSQTVYSDCPGCGPNKKWFTKICVGDNCVSYNRQCDNAEHPTYCEYFFDKYMPVDVMAKSEEDFQNAITTIGLVSSDRHKSDFPFSLFSEESKAPHNPHAPMINYMLPKNPKNEEGQQNGSN